MFGFCIQDWSIHLVLLLTQIFLLCLCSYTFRYLSVVLSSPLIGWYCATYVLHFCGISSDWLHLLRRMSYNVLSSPLVGWYCATYVLQCTVISSDRVILCDVRPTMLSSLFWLAALVATFVLHFYIECDKW